ncbi:hypothetical protein [Haliea sp. E17]
MNLRAAKNELGEPPKVGVQLLVLEAVGLLLVTLLLVNLVE